MYALEQSLDSLRARRLGREQLFSPAIAAALRDLATRHRRAVTLYYDREGVCRQACHGDARPEARHLRRRSSNRLSRLRGLRVLPPHAELPRGRDRSEVTELRLDALLVLSLEGPAVLLTPETEAGAPTGGLLEERVDALAGFVGRSLRDLLEHLEGDLGPRQAAPRRAAGLPRALLVGAEFHQDRFRSQSAASMDELERLARTADLEPGGRMTQRLSGPVPGTFLGKGKLEEARARVLDEGFEAVVFAHDLPYVTVRRLTEALGVQVIDRSELILEIFARHATTNEGRLQVKRARLEHELHRLLKEEKDLDRQGGGIGVRGGPGETASALAKRRIHRKKLELDERLERARRKRAEGRRRRTQGELPRVALAGYTNAGKSTLLNALAGREEVVARDQLFTTLTTTTRRLPLPSGRPALVSDTVGFVEDLPHHLVAAFESTLLEAADTDLCVVVLEADPAHFERHLAAVNEVLDRLGSDPSKRMLALSKIDQVGVGERQRLAAALPGALAFSSLSGEGLDELRRAIEARLGAGEVERELELGFDQLAELDALFEQGRVLEHRWSEDGVWLRARLPREEARAG